MKITYSAFILPHIGDKYRQCADRFSCGEAKRCFAIADGVGNSLLPEIWASLLCQDYMEHPEMFCNNSHLVRADNLIDKWEQERTRYEANLSDDARFIYEMGLLKADYAASTFVGLQLDTHGWICEAIGDSYLFVLDQQYNIIQKVASMNGSAFDNFPEYFASKKGKDNGKVVKVHGSYDNVTYFALMTDALSDWFISTKDSNKKALMLSSSSHKQFEKFVNQERKEGRMKDDDTTLVILKVENEIDDELLFEKNVIDDIESFISEEADEHVELDEKDLDTAPIVSDNDTHADETLETIRIGPLLDKASQLLGNIKGYNKKTHQNILTKALNECSDCINKLIYYIKNHGTPN